MDNISHIKRRELLKGLVEEWNANRLDLFEISLPDDHLEYHGVMRFLFQDAGAKLATKCIRVSSTANTEDVIETLVEKFRPDMKMLTTPIYHLYEVDSNGVERRLDLNEYPLEVQLNWTNDEKEGKFVLRNAAHKAINVQKADKNESSFKRKLSKREKKEQKKKQEKGGDDNKENDEEPSGVFVRTKSNSEAVMRRRRELKVQKKLDEIQKEGDHGGLLKVHGDSLNPDVPYKSLLLSETDTASYVVEEMLDKYGYSRALSLDYCLVQVFNAHAGEIGGGLRPQEHVLEDDECPLAILQLQVNRGNITFHIRRRDGKQASAEDRGIPFLLELNLDGTDIMKPKKHLLHTNLTEVGSIAQPSSGQHLRMIGPTIEPHHAVIANIEGVVTVTPNSKIAECYVEGKRIDETTVLKHGKVVRFGHHHAFRFFDPAEEEIRRRNMPEVLDGPIGIDGGPPGYSPRMDDVLPAGLEFRDEGEDNFLHSVISDVTEGIITQFKLAPCYSLYLAARYRVDRVQPGIPMGEHYHKLLMFCNKMSFMIRDCVNRFRSSPQELAFWMANMSELLHFFKMDNELHKHSHQAQAVLADTVQDAFKDLVYIMQGDLFQSMPAFLSDNDNDSEAGEVLHVLSSAMSLLRRCRVNAALTIQLFSQLFHFINMWLFNKLVTEPHLGLITRQWGIRLKRRLSRVEVWAEKQGLELAADCHLCRISQAAHLLQAPKHSPDDIASISSSCFKLNSLQLRALLELYRPEPGEMPQVPQDVIESVVSVARNTADDLTRAEGRDITVGEDTDLQLPFLLPEDGYSCDTIKGIPPGLTDFLEPVIADGLCRLTPLPSQSGSWQIFMADVDEMGSLNDEPISPPRSLPEINNGMLPPPVVSGIEVDRQSPLPSEPEIIHIQLHKVNGSMGLSIVAAKGESQPEKGIYIKSVVGGGAADLDRRLKAGDQLLEVDGKSLVGLTQERAADLMKDTGQVVDLHVVKQGAIYHGLATLLNQPTPPMGRAAGPPPQDNPSYMVQSKSTPLLNDENYNRKAPQFGGVVPHPSEDMRSKSQGNLMRDEDRMRWQQQQQQPGGSPPADIRTLSQPDLGRGPDSPNYQNYPGELPPGQRPVSQYRDMPNGAPIISSAGPAPNRPRSEFVDPAWYPPPGDDRQPIYQNHVMGKPPPPQQQQPRPGFDDRELPSPPMNDRPPPVPPHPSEEDQLPLPPPPASDYVNYQLGGGPPPRPNLPHQQSQPRARMDSSNDPRFARPDLRGPQEPPRGATEPPPWARGSQRPAPGLVRAGPPSPRSPTGPPAMRPGYPGPLGPAGPPGPGLMGQQGPRPQQPGDIMRGAPIIQPYRPPQPHHSDSFRGPPPVRGPQPAEQYRGPVPRQPIRPQNSFTHGPQGYSGPPNLQNPPMRGQRPPVTQQMLQSQINHVNNNPWTKESDARRLADDRRLQREDTIRDLESKPYRTPDEEDRLDRFRLDSEFEKRAEQARRDDSEEDDQSMGRSYPGQMIPNRGYQPPPPMSQQQSLRRPGLPINPQQDGAPASVKRDMLQSKTVTFKPAYRGEDTLRPGDLSKHAIKSGPDDIRPLNPQQDLLRHQREQPAAPYAPSTSEREALRTRLEEQLREKQRRETQDARRSFHMQEDEEMRRRREHDLSLRKESERIQTQHMNDAHKRYGGDSIPPPQQIQHRSPGPQRDYPTSQDRSQRYSQGGFKPEGDPSRLSYQPPPQQTNRFQQPPPPTSQQNYTQQPYQSSELPNNYSQPPNNYSQQPNNYSQLSPPQNHFNNNKNYNTNAVQHQPLRTSIHGGDSSTPTMDIDMPTGNTPGVIGAQEVYRDPRSRIESQQRSQKPRGEAGDRLSFRDKLSLFSAEAGEGTPVQKPKSSKSQRALEESLAYGNGHM